MGERVSISHGTLQLELAPEAGGSVAAFSITTAAGIFDLMRRMVVPEGSTPPALYSGMFPMLPFANCIRGNHFGFKGRAYQVAPNMADSRLNFHGSGWQSAWQVGTVAKDRAELVLDDGVVDDVYRYSARQRFVLGEDGLTASLSLRNEGERAMPFSFGLHPWFPRHDGAQIRFNAGGFWTEGPDGEAGELIAVPPDGDYTKLRTPPLSRQNNCYAGWDGRAEIAWREAGLELRIIADPVFKHLMFHVPATGEPVFCLEPQTNAPCGFDGLEHGDIQPGVVLLQPGEEAGGSVRFEPLALP